MFTTFSNAVSQLVGSKTEPSLTTVASDVSPQPETKTSLSNASQSYPDNAYAVGYDGDVQPQYGCYEPSGGNAAKPFDSVSFQIGSTENESYHGTTDSHSVKGKITHLYHDYGLIDHSIHFKYDAVRFNGRPKIGAQVEAILLSGSYEDVGIRASDVTIITEVDWTDGDAGDEAAEWFIGKVTSADKTTGEIENTVQYNQDALPYNFVPHRGDWVLAEIIRNHKTKQSRVKTIRPLREKRFCGRVTLLYPGYGFVDGTIFFSRKACERNYNPQKNDLVVGKAVESEHSKGTWRAISVERKEQHSPIQAKQFPAHDVKNRDLMRNKNDILVTISGGCDKMVMGEEKKITAFVRNKGKECQKLLKCEAVCLLADVRLSIDGEEDEVKETKRASTLRGPVDIPPASRRCVTVEIIARSVGVSVCQLILSFDGFSISRPIPVSVKEEKREEGRRSLSGKDRWMQENSLQLSGREPTVYPGVRPQFTRKGNPNVPVKLPMYRMDNQLRQWYADKKDLTKLVPELKEALSLENYSTFFSTLLHIEELKMEVDMREFDMERASMRPRGEFLCLEVPGLAEGRPSVLCGDKVMLVDPYGGPNSPRYEGYVHEVHSEDILLKFHASFHERYGAEEFNVMFTFSRTTLRRCHQAAELASSLGKEVLFPTELEAKPPQTDVMFVTVQRSVVYPGPSKPTDIPRLPTPKSLQAIKAQAWCTSPPKEQTSGATNDASGVDEANKEDGVKFVVPNALKEGIIMTAMEMDTVAEREEKAEFFNKKLNPRQRAAVTRILKGEGRPTPYVLFGPPGTGKTITIVEAILQIHHHLPESRILACTPSNSAADLLTERLHLSGRVKAIDMIRLNSFRRLDENIPESIHQYCTVGYELRAASHHRIILATCATGGSFFSLGLKQGHFTHVILDEAGQAQEPEALVAIALAAGPDGQVVLAGDPMQLGPVLASSQAAELGLEQSLLERLMKRDLYQRDTKTYRDHGGYNPLLVTKLVNNYRSHPMLLKLPSKCFYHDELNACANITMRERLCSWNTLPNKDGCPIIFHGTQGVDMKEGNSPSWCNPSEALQVLMYLQGLLGCEELHLKESEIGIITPYRKQVEKLNLLLDSMNNLETKVGSVEEFQGQERPVIIISTVRSSSSLMAFDIRHQLGFLSNPKRFNVAITRPQSLLIVVGNPHLLVNDFYWRALLKFCLQNGAYVGCEPPSEEVFARLDGPEEAEEEVPATDQPIQAQGPQEQQAVHTQGPQEQQAVQEGGPATVQSTQARGTGIVQAIQVQDPQEQQAVQEGGPATVQSTQSQGTGIVQAIQVQGPRKQESVQDQAVQEQTAHKEDVQKQHPGEGTTSCPDGPSNGEDGTVVDVDHVPSGIDGITNTCSTERIAEKEGLVTMLPASHEHSASEASPDKREEENILVTIGQVRQEQPAAYESLTHLDGAMAEEVLPTMQIAHDKLPSRGAIANPLGLVKESVVPTLQAMQEQPLNNNERIRSPERLVEEKVLPILQVAPECNPSENKLSDVAVSGVNSSLNAEGEEKFASMDSVREGNRLAGMEEKTGRSMGVRRKGESEQNVDVSVATEEKLSGSHNITASNGKQLIQECNKKRQSKGNPVKEDVSPRSKEHVQSPKIGIGRGKPKREKPSPEVTKRVSEATTPDRHAAPVKEFQTFMAAAKRECDNMEDKQKVKELAMDIVADLKSLKLPDKPTGSEKSTKLKDESRGKDDGSKGNKEVENTFTVPKKTNRKDEMRNKNSKVKPDNTSSCKSQLLKSSSSATCDAEQEQEIWDVYADGKSGDTSVSWGSEDECPPLVDAGSALQSRGWYDFNPSSTVTHEQSLFASASGTSASSFVYPPNTLHSTPKNHVLHNLPDTAAQRLLNAPSAPRVQDGRRNDNNHENKRRGGYPRQRTPLTGSSKNTQAAKRSGVTLHRESPNKVTEIASGSNSNRTNLMSGCRGEPLDPVRTETRHLTSPSGPRQSESLQASARLQESSSSRQSDNVQSGSRLFKYYGVSRPPSESSTCTSDDAAYSSIKDSSSDENTGEEFDGAWLQKGQSGIDNVHPDRERQRQWSSGSGKSDSLTSSSGIVGSNNSLEFVNSRSTQQFQNVQRFTQDPPAASSARSNRRDNRKKQNPSQTRNSPASEQTSRGVETRKEPVRFYGRGRGLCLNSTALMEPRVGSTQQNTHGRSVFTGSRQQQQQAESHHRSRPFQAYGTNSASMEPRQCLPGHYEQERGQYSAPINSRSGQPYEHMYSNERVQSPRLGRGYPPQPSDERGSSRPNEESERQRRSSGNARGAGGFRRGRGIGGIRGRGRGSFIATNFNQR